MLFRSPLMARARDQRGVLGAVLVVLTMSGLVTGLVWSLVTDGEGRALTAAAMRADGMTGSGSPDLIAVTVMSTDGLATPGLAELVAPAIDAVRADVPNALSAWAQSPELPIGGDTPAAAYLLDIDDLESHTEVVEGRLPLATSGNPQVAISVDTALALGRGVGDTIPLFASVAAVGDGETPAVEATVVGVVHLVGAQWERDLLQGRGVATDRGWLDTYGPLLTAPGAVTARTDAAAPARLSIVIDPSFADGVDLPAFASAVRALEGDLARDLGSTARATVRSDVSALSDAAARDLAVSRSIVIAASAVAVALAVVALALTGTLLVARRQTETALWRVRGASAGQLAVRAAREALALGMVAAALAVPAAASAYAALLHLPVLTRAWPLADTVRPLTLGTVLAVAVGVALPTLALIVAAALAPTTTQREHVGAAGRAGLDGALVILACVAVWQLSRSGLGNAADLTSMLAPMLVVLACGAAALRVIPLAVRVMERFAHRSRGLTFALAGWGLARSGATRGAYLFAAGAAAVVVAMTTVSTWTASAVQQVDVQVGADAVVAEPMGPGVVPRLAEASACSVATAVSDRPVLLGSRPAGTRVVAFDTAQSDLVRGETGSARSWADVLEPLVPPSDVGGWHVANGFIDAVVSGQIDVDGAQLSAGVVAIIEDSYGDRFPSARVDVPLDGAPHSLRFNVPDADDDGGEWWVVGFAITVQADSTAPDRTTSDAVVTGAITIETGSGNMARPETAWTPTVPDTNTTLRAHAEGMGPSAVHIEVEARDYELVWSAVSMIVTAFPPPEDVPVLIGADFARDLGVVPGDAVEIRLDGRAITVRVADIVQAVPSRPHSEALIGDIDTLSRALLVHGHTQRITDAWWLGLGCDNADADAVRAIPASTLLTEARADAAAGPLRVGAWMSLWIAAVASVVFVIAGAAVRSAARVRSRALVVARLRGLGVPARMAGTSELLQLVLLVAVATVLGAAVGAIGAWVTAPLVVVAPGGLPAVPAPTWVAAGPWPWLLVGTATAAVLVAVPWVRALARRSPALTLRGGDDA